MPTLTHSFLVVQQTLEMGVTVGCDFVIVILRLGNI